LRQILGLDLVRFSAALMVMAVHFGQTAWLPTHRASYPRIVDGVSFPELVAYSWFGWVGVPIFFVISGFVIAYSAEQASAAAFLRSRFLRLFPTIAIAATLTATVAGATGLHPPAELVWRYLATLVVLPTGPWVTNIYWTLAVEIQFYALVYLLLRLGRFDRLPALLTGLALLSVAYWAAKAAFKALPLAEIAPWGPGLLAALDLIPFFAAAAQFALGGMLWLCLCKKATPFRLGVVGLTFAVSCMGILARAVGETEGQFTLMIVIVFALAMGVTVASVRWNEAAHRVIGHARVIRQIGLMTYPLYLLHNLIGVAAIQWLVLNGVQRHAALVAGVVLVLGLSFAVSAWAEPALRRYLGRRIGGSAPREAVAAA
jgi:peptidoglycan/LPS O-acetylase OafA/YrhL